MYISSNKCIQSYSGCIQLYRPKKRVFKGVYSSKQVSKLYTGQKKAYKGVDWCILLQTGVSTRIQGVFSCIDPKNGCLQAFTARNRGVQLYTVERHVYNSSSRCIQSYSGCIQLYRPEKRVF